MGKVRVFNGSSWVDASDVRVYSGGWTDASRVLVYNGSSWVEAWVKSDPIVLNFYPVWTGAFGEGHNEDPMYTMNDTSVYQGDWDAVGHDSGMQRVDGVMRFDQAAIISAFGGRTICSSITLRLTTDTQYTSNGIHPSIWSTTHGLTNSKVNDLGSTPAKANNAIGSRITSGNSTTTALSTAVGNGILAGTIKGLICYRSGTSEAEKELYRGSFYGTEGTTGQRPYLTITADYV